MTNIEYRSHMTVELVSVSASDESVVRAARVSTRGSESGAVDPQKDAGLIRYLMRDRHGSPFEHNQFVFLVEAPIFVMREMMRHRIGTSFNEESGRYRELRPVFYVPGTERKLVQQGKPGHYTFTAGTEAQHRIATSEMKQSYREAYNSYQYMLEDGIAKEVARSVLPVGLYSSAYVTMNARSLMNFLSLRVEDEGAMFPSHPQREIEMVAEHMEQHFATAMPITHEAFIKNGRVSP